ncbi:hypothetical protein N8T08_009340 [Aspergillus melleus]|uniref:Uncharacterized protein n=1 Tax=Aspergillus melleus TaxID=138277 RepID=A0ACC3ATR1_9EURO|nr:hypothetical protein N8T08_009340 [Aspergillus melleus]
MKISRYVSEIPRSKGSHRQMASTIPIVLSTVVYGLKYRANLQPGETVLIHSAAGGVGLAAIQYAKHLGAKVFATVGNDSKRSFLVESYDLDPSHIFCSRDSSFLSSKETTTYGANPPLPETETIKRGLCDDNDTNRSSALDALRTAVCRKISNLILLAEGVLLGPDQPLREFWLGSMLAWNVDIPSVVFLNKYLTVNGLVGSIAEELGGGRGP